MRYLRFLFYALVSLVLVAGWAFFYWQASSLDFGAVNAARTAVDALRSVDARWNDQLVAAMRNSAAPAEPPRHGAAYSALEVQTLKLVTSNSANLLPGPLGSLVTALGLQSITAPPLGVALSGVKHAFDERAALIERFAALRAEAAAPAEDADAQARRTETLAAAEAVLDQAWLAPSGPRLASFSRELERTADDMTSQSEVYRTWLLYYSAFLLIVLAYMVGSLASSRAQIDRINHQLREANETLEQRVRERTRELSDALERLKESEAMLIQSEKMSSLGQMVAGIAHEVNTPLAYVKASLETVRTRFAAGGRLAEQTERLLGLLAAESPDEAALAAQFATVRGLVEGARNRQAQDEVETALKDGLYGIGQIGEIVGNLRNFSRLDRSKVADFDLNEGIDATLRIAHHQLGARTLRRELGDIPRVSCSPSQVNQVLLNLVNNAAQATPEQGGVITLRSARRGDDVAVDVIDNGHGIPADVLPKIFDPFFTTKDVGKGTGLGLSICYKIVEAHGGRLEVDSQPGKGTRFTLLLPVKAREPAAATAEAARG
jgi:signal transduction histidine kinase